MNKLEHIGIAVKNLEQANLKFSKLLGSPPYKIEEVAAEGVRVSFFKVDNLKIELLEATNPDSPIAKFIDKRGEGIHHLAFATSNIEKKCNELIKEGFSFITPEAKVGADNKKINFLHPKTTNGVLVELCQENI